MPPTDLFPILSAVETPDFFDPEGPEPGAPTPGGYAARAEGGLWAAGERVTWVAGLVLAFVTAFVILAAWHEVQTLFGV